MGVDELETVLLGKCELHIDNVGHHFLSLSNMLLFLPYHVFVLVSRSGLIGIMVLMLTWVVYFYCWYVYRLAELLVLAHLLMVERDSLHLVCC